MILAIDAGNTRTKWGLHDGHAWKSLGAIATGDSSTIHEALPPILPADQAIASNVAGPGARANIAAACARIGVPIAFVQSEREQLGVKNGYRDPAQLGTDRWAALIAAHHLAETGDKLVVNAGTALTIDALTSDGRFLGGLIVPGPSLMRHSLDRGTASLRLTEGTLRDFPDSTPDAIASGAIQAAAGAIERLAHVMAAHGSPPGRIILSGGAAAEIAGSLSLKTILHENLVLDGLVLIARNA